jgi:hypothetical protein
MRDGRIVCDMYDLYVLEYSKPKPATEFEAAIENQLGLGNQFNSRGTPELFFGHASAEESDNKQIESGSCKYQISACSLLSPDSIPEPTNYPTYPPFPE